MEITKVVKPFIRRGWPNTRQYSVCVFMYVCMYILLSIDRNKLIINIFLKLIAINPT